MIRIMKYGALPENEIFARSDSTADVSAAVAEIIENVRRKGDAALLDYTRRFDGADIDSPELDKEEIEAAYRRIPAALTFPGRYSLAIYLAHQPILYGVCYLFLHGNT